MTLVDVNLWVYAFRKDSPLHQQARKVFADLLQGDQPFLYCPGVATSFLRLVTNPKIFKNPSTVQEAWGFVEVLQDHPKAIFAETDPITLGIFKHINLVYSSFGNQIPDDLLVALAIRHNAIFITSDRGFERYRELNTRFIE